MGYNSVFSNILQMLNLADLGIGVAITSFLYKPLAENDTETVNCLMLFYKKLYQMIGTIIVILGILISIILPVLIPDAKCSANYLRVLFYINLLGTVSTYFLAYKRTLLTADQKSYIISIIDTSTFFIFTILQIITLFVYPNYILYLIIQIAKNIISNIIVGIRCKKIYGSIDKHSDKQIISTYKPKIIKYVKDVFISRVGAYVYYSTDNIILSIFKGSILTGYLSNYTLVTTQVNNIINQILASIQSTFGNYINVHIDDKAKQKQMTDNYLCANFCIGNLCMICIMFLIQPFIGLVFGNNYILNFTTATLMAINLMLTILIQLPSQVFMIYKLYHFDKPIVVIAAILNIVISTVLVSSLGIDGVLIGTTVTSLIYLFSRLYIISKVIYRTSYIGYVKKIISYGLISMVSCIIIWFMTRNNTITGVLSFGIRTIAVSIVGILVPVLLLYRTIELQFLINKLIPLKLKCFIKPSVIFVITVFTIIIFLILGK